jgi:mono/diheme cytochrome c family protein
MPRQGRLLVLAAITILTSTGLAAAGLDAAETYRGWCAVCHGADGRAAGPIQALPGRAPDFTDCSRTTVEPDADWALVIARGGPAVGRSPVMPPFGVLTGDEIANLIRYLRGFCREDGWPSGNLNFLHPVFAAQAFPEGEAVLRPVVSHGLTSRPRTRLEVAYARRLGRRSQVEVGLPAETLRWLNRQVTGVGDVSLRVKRVMAADDRRHVIVSVGTELSFPTGSQRWGFGEGTEMVEPFVAAGVQVRRIQLQGDLELRLPARRVPSEPVHRLSYDVAALYLPRAASSWAAGAEIGGLGSGLGVTPELLRRLTPSGALWLGVGVRIPLRPTSPEATDLVRWSGYLRWDYREPLRRR